MDIDLVRTVNSFEEQCHRLKLPPKLESGAALAAEVEKLNKLVGEMLASLGRS